jgi:4-amino-4-deoxy-L-arabinose transferase-like glycosyltransferase
LADQVSTDRPGASWRKQSVLQPRLRAALAACAAAAAVVMAAASTYYLSQGYDRDLVPVGFLLAWVSVMTLGAALGLAGMRQPEIKPADAAMSVRMTLWHWLAVAIGLFLLLFSAELNGNMLNRDPAPWLHYDLQFLILVAGFAALSWGLAAAGRPRLPHWWDLPPSRRREILLMVLLTLVALALRLWMIGPVLRVYIDEIHFTSAIQRFWWGERNNLLQPFSSIAAFPYLYPYWQTWAVHLFGRDLGSIRAVSAVFGALTVPALYLLGKHLFDRKTALVAAFLLLTFPPHLQFSRIGLNNIADPVFAVLAMGFLVRGIKKGQRYNFVLAGLSLGLTQYFYEGGRLLYPPLIGLWLLLLITMWRRSNGRHVLLFAVTAVIVAMPVYYTLVGMKRPLAQRVETVGYESGFWQQSLNDPQSLSQQMLRKVTDNLLLWVGRPDGQYYYSEHEPLVAIFLTPLLILGIGYGLWWLLSPSGLLLMLWLGAAVMGVTIFMETLSTTARWAVIFPALVLLMAVGLRCTITLLLTPLHRPRRDQIVSGALVGSVALLVLMQGLYYGGFIVPNFMRFHYRYQPGQEAIWLAAEHLPPNTHLHLIHNRFVSEIDARGMIEFLSDGITLNSRRPSELTEEYLLQRDYSKHQAFIITTKDLIEDPSYYRLIDQNFTITQVIESEDRWTEEYGFVLLFSPADAPPPEH